MAIKSFKPYTPSRRNMTVSAFDGVDKKMCIRDRNGTENVDQMLHGRTFTAEDGEREQAAHHGERAEQGGEGELFRVFHDDTPL